MDNLYRVLKIVQINVNTVRFFSRIWTKNNLRNLLHIVRSPGVKSLERKFSGKPAILVSAGPSLDKNIDTLRKASGKAVILCADTSLRPLLKRGIKPQFVMSIDAQPITYRHFSGLDVNDVNLVGVTRLPPELLSLFDGRAFLCNDMNNVVWKTIAPYFGRLGELGSGSTVAVLGFDIARLMGCDPIIFVGQDFSYSYGRAYAADTMTYNDMLQQLSTHATIESITGQRKAGEYIIRTSGMSASEPLVDIHGRPTEMSDGMQGWLTWFILEIKRTKARCINASEAGILVDGVDVMPLEEAISDYCSKPFDVAKVLSSRKRSDAAGETQKAARELASIGEKLQQVLSRANSIAEATQVSETDVQWLAEVRSEGNVCGPLSAMIDWFKQRHSAEYQSGDVKLDVVATAWACEFTLKQIAEALRLLKG